MTPEHEDARAWLAEIPEICTLLPDAHKTLRNYGHIPSNERKP